MEIESRHEIVALGDGPSEGREWHLAEIYPPVSPEAEAIGEAAGAPIQERRPGGYQRDFLDDYRPNVA